MNEHVAGEEMAAYIDGALKGEARVGIEAHLCRCSECLEALAEVLAIQGGRAKVPDEFLRRVLGEKDAALGKILPFRPVFAVVAVFLVAVIAGYFFIPRGGRETAKNAAVKMPRIEEVTTWKEQSFRPRFSGVEAVQLILAVAGRAAAPLAIQAEAAPRRSHVRIEGEVGRADLLDSGWLDGWEWFPEGPILKLEIAADGKVVSVIPFGDWDPLAAAEAEALARKLTFAVAEKGRRRAVLSARRDPN